MVKRSFEKLFPKKKVMNIKHLMQSFSLGLAVLLTFFVFSPTFNAGYVNWDDPVHFLENVSIRSLDHEHLWDIFSLKINHIYLPLTALSYAIEYKFFGYNPFISHLINILLHLGSVVLIFFLAMRLGLSTLGAFLSALIFGIHPMHVESVAWVTGRKDVLCGVLFLGSLLSYIQFLDGSKKDSFDFKSKSFKWFVMAYVLGLFSVLAKPAALGLPLILILLDWITGRGLSRRCFFEKLPMFVIFGLLSLATFLGTARPLGNSFFEGGLIWLWSFAFYLKKFFWPDFYVPVYDLPKPIAFHHPEYLMALAVFLLVIAAVIFVRRFRWLMFAVFSYLFSIFFILRFDDVTMTVGMNVVADRYIYLPSIGFCFLFGFVFQRSITIIKKSRAPQLRFLLMIFVVSIVGFLGVKSFFQSAVWMNSITLWRHEIQYQPNNFVAYNNLPTELRDLPEYKKAEEQYRKILSLKLQGIDTKDSPEIRESEKKVKEIFSAYQRAIQLNPTFLDPYYNLGRMYRDLGFNSESAKLFEKIIEVEPKYKDAYVSLADVYQDMNETSKAISVYEKVLSLNSKDEETYANIILAYVRSLKQNPNNKELQKGLEQTFTRFEGLLNVNPNNSVAFFNLGYLYSEAGYPQRAISAYERALEINPSNSKVFYNMGNVYKDLGQFDKAIEMYQKTVKLDQGYSDAFLNIGIIYNKTGNLDQAKEYYALAVRANPSNAKAYFNLGYVLEKKGELREAQANYFKVVQYDPNNSEAYYNLGNVYVSLDMPKKAISSYLKTVEIDPKHVNAWVNLSILSFKAGDFLKAVSYCDQAIMLGYDAPEGYLNALEPYRRK